MLVPRRHKCTTKEQAKSSPLNYVQYNRSISSTSTELGAQCILSRLGLFVRLLHRSMPVYLCQD